MLASLSLIFIVGLAMGAICQKLKLPRIIGILVTGIVLGPYVLGACLLYTSYDTIMKCLMRYLLQIDVKSQTTEHKKERRKLYDNLSLIHI